MNRKVKSLKQTMFLSE